MKLKLLKLASRLLGRSVITLTRWHEEVGWKVIASTPVGLNPHEKSTMSWFLWEEGNRLKAALRLEAKYGPNPWVKIIKRKITNRTNRP